MKLVATIILGMCLASRLWATDPTTTAYDQELTQITTDLSKRLEGTSIKTIAAVDFKDLQGKPTNLGKFLSEEISTSMAMQDRNISMADRANLKRIMDEYKLTEDGLVNPENAKKLGQLAGLDAIMFGTVIPFGNGYRVDVKVIATDTGKFAAAARGTFAKSDSLDSLAEVKDGIVSTANTETPQDADAPPPPPKQKKYNLGGASVEIKSVEYFKSQKKVRVFYSVTLTPAPYSYYYSTSAFAYHTNDLTPVYGQVPEVQLIGNATDDNGVSYKILVPPAALSQPKLSPNAPLTLELEFQITEPKVATQAPAKVTFSFEFYAGEVGNSNSLYRCSVSDYEFDKIR